MKDQELCDLKKANQKKLFQNEVQKNIAHFVLENGSDLVVGSHPHVLQGIEKYRKGKTHRQICPQSAKKSWNKNKDYHKSKRF